MKLTVDATVTAVLELTTAEVTERALLRHAADATE